MPLRCRNYFSIYSKHTDCKEVYACKHWCVKTLMTDAVLCVFKRRHWQQYYMEKEFFVCLPIISFELSSPSHCGIWYVCYKFFPLRFYHNKLHLSFIYLGRGTAVTMKNMLESQFPGIHVALANYPPPLPKRLLSKVVPVFQFGIIGLVMGGEHIFPRLGFAVPPPWFYSLRANRFGTMASTWLLGNFFQSMLQSSGAFEVYCNGELVFSKLKESRFPGEIELKDVVGRKIANPRVVDGLGASSWS